MTPHFHHPWAVDKIDNLSTVVPDSGDLDSLPRFSVFYSRLHRQYYSNSQRLQQRYRFRGVGGIAAGQFCEAVSGFGQMVTLLLVLYSACSKLHCSTETLLVSRTLVLAQSHQSDHHIRLMIHS
jgi:hypothetical protein